MSGWDNISDECLKSLNINRIAIETPCTIHIIILFAAYYRFVVLLFNCLLSFGSYFCMDIPSVLQDQFQGVYKFGQGCLGMIRTEWFIILFWWRKPLDVNKWGFLVWQNLTCPNATATNETVECVLGLGMSPQQYNSLSTIYSWT